MKKEILVKIICLAAALVIISVATVFVSDVGNHDTSDTVSRVFIDFSRSLSNVNDLLSSFLNAEEISEIRAIAQKFSEELKKARQDYNLLNVSGKKGTIDSFLNLSGDYVVSYAEEKISGTASAEQKAKLEKMKRFTGRFYEEISKIDANQSSAELTEKIRESYQKVNGEISREETALPVTSKVEDTLETEDNGNLLNNAKEVNHETALQMAASFIKTENAEVRSEMKNGIDVFCIIGSGEEVSVSKKGGYIVSLIRNDTEEIKNFDNEQCVQKAKDFLAEAFKVLTVARYLENDNETCYIVFTTKNGATFCNPDKIEITVSKLSGEILKLNATEFLLNYRNRTVTAPKYSESEAEQTLNENLVVKQAKQVIIKSDETETTCYEFLCDYNESQQKLIYVDTQNLKILEEVLLPENKNGIFLK